MSTGSTEYLCACHRDRIHGSAASFEGGARRCALHPADDDADHGELVRRDRTVQCERRWGVFEPWALPTSGGDFERNVAIMYASHEVLNSLMPEFADDWNAMMGAVGLDPNNDATDDSPAGIGNQAGAAVVSAREQDGMNQLGNEEGSPYHRRPYSDYTSYRPVNSAERLRDARRWQPDTLTNGNGIFFSQQFVTPQLGVTEPFSYERVTRKAPRPNKSYAVKRKRKPRKPYIEQANEVLSVQVSLTDRQKLMAEFFDNKISSLGFSTLAASLYHGLSLEQFVQIDFLVNVAAFDTAITIWLNKRRFDAVRPFTAIGVIYGDESITAWGGPGRSAPRGDRFVSVDHTCLLYTSPSPRDQRGSRMPSSA